MFKTFAVSFALFATVAQATVISSFSRNTEPQSGGIPETFQYATSDLLAPREYLDVLDTGQGHSLAEGDIQFEVETSTGALFAGQTFSFTHTLQEPFLFSWGAFMGFGTYQVLRYPTVNLFDAAAPESNYGPIYFAIAGVLLFAARLRNRTVR
jgi:hypothetical protein